MTVLLGIAIAAIAAGVLVLVLSFTEACRPGQKRAHVITATIVGAFLFLAGSALTVQQFTADDGKVSVSGKLDVSGKEALR